MFAAQMPQKNWTHTILYVNSFLMLLTGWVFFLMQRPFDGVGYIEFGAVNLFAILMQEIHEWEKLQMKHNMLADSPDTDDDSEEEEEEEDEEERELAEQVPQEQALTEQVSQKESLTDQSTQEQPLTDQVPQEQPLTDQERNQVVEEQSTVVEEEWIVDDADEQPMPELPPVHEAELPLPELASPPAGEPLPQEE